MKVALQLFVSAVFAVVVQGIVVEALPSETARIIFVAVTIWLAFRYGTFYGRDKP